MSDSRGEIHVGDVGTLYRVRVLDDALPFDPTLATVKRLIFDLPGNGVVEKDATVTPNGSPETEWYLDYQVQPLDGPGSPPVEFHLEPGRLKVQAYLEWADGSKYHSDVRTTDDAGRELRIYPNLA